jgi:phosphoglycolate phosphatase-like HAD superfamily hydrolase
VLILFDIDMTLLKTNGAGRRAMQNAGAALFGRASRSTGSTSRAASIR